MADTRLSVRVPAELAERLDRVAKESARTRSYVALRAIESYCESEEEVLDKIREGLADLEEGRWIPHERMAPWLRGLSQGKARRPPRPR